MLRYRSGSVFICQRAFWEGEIMNKRILLVAVLVLGAFGLFTVTNNSNTPETDDQSSLETTQQQSTLSANEDGTVVTYDAVVGVTALETLRSLTEVQTQNSDFGEFVTGIGGVDADSNTQYWSFYLNGEYASEGAGTLVGSDGDTFEWRLEEL